MIFWYHFLMKMAQWFYPERTFLATIPVTHPHSLMSNKLTIRYSCAQEPTISLGWRQWPDVTSKTGAGAIGYLDTGTDPTITVRVQLLEENGFKRRRGLRPEPLCKREAGAGPPPVKEGWTGVWLSFGTVLGEESPFWKMLRDRNKLDGPTLEIKPIQ